MFEIQSSNYFSHLIIRKLNSLEKNQKICTLYMKKSTKQSRFILETNICSYSRKSSFIYLVTFTEEILKGKLHFLCSGIVLSFLIVLLL